MKHFFDQTPETLRAMCDELGLPRYAPSQLLDWVYRRGADDLSEMTDISRANRAKLAERLFMLRGEEAAHQIATDGTQKLLIGWPPAAPPPSLRGEVGGWVSRAETESGETHPQAPSLEGRGTMGSPSERALPLVAQETRTARPEATRETECVMIPDERRRTACVSSQVGCPVGCAFCASGIGGLEGNLTRGQIVEQVFRLTQHLQPPPSLREGDSGWMSGAEPDQDTTHPLTPSLQGRGDMQRISHIVFMGMGEPLANFQAVTGAVRTFNAPWGYGISARRITISTVGLPEAIRKLVNFDLPVTLALSLHAPNDELRRRLIPWANYTTIAELLEACDEYFQSTGREITLEYILLRHVNDRPEHAQELATIAKRLRSNVNLIRYNEVRGLPFERPATEDVRRFQEILRERGVNAHIRRSRGRDIAAACGQLRHERQRVG